MLGGGRSCPRPRSTHCGTDHTDSVSFLRSGRYRARLAWRPGASPPSASLASSISPNGGPGVEADQLPPSTTMSRSPTPSNTPSVWVNALWAWPTLTRCPTQARVSPSLTSPPPCVAVSYGQHSEASAPQHLSGWFVIVLAHRLILP